MNDGIYFSGGQVITSGGRVLLSGTAGGGSGNYDNGVVLTTASLVSAGGGAVEVDGWGAGSGSYEYGVAIAGGSHANTSGSGYMYLFGVGSSGRDGNMGVNLTDTNTLVSDLAGGLQIDANGYGSGSWNYEIGVQSDARVSTTSGAL
jgi:hypothetical protein